MSASENSEIFFLTFNFVFLLLLSLPEKIKRKHKCYQFFYRRKINYQAKEDNQMKLRCNRSNKGRVMGAWTCLMPTEMKRTFRCLSSEKNKMKRKLTWDGGEND